MTEQQEKRVMEQNWLIIERLENWEADEKNGFSFFGLPRRYRNIASQITKGDKVYCYVSGVGAFSDIRAVRDPGIKEIKEDSFHDIYTRNFACYFTTSPIVVLPRESWIPLYKLVPFLELTKERTPSSRRAIFQTSIRKLSTADAKLLSARIKSAAEGVDRAVPD
jgi:hypothetical protein